MTAETVQPLRPDFDPAPLPEVVGGFKTVLADPPWRFTNRTGKVAPEHRRLDRYSTMTLAAIKDIEVAEVAAKNAHLYLWVPNALLPDGLAVMEAWGFRYVSNVVWAKRRKDGGPDGRGVGFYFRNVTEILLFGVRGSMRTMAPARRQVNMIETRKREHSRKPDEQYELIEACSPGPHLELFARHPRKGWSVWGDESLDDVAPRGKVHRGYAGGPIDTPDLDPYERLQPDTQAAVAAIHHHPRERTTRMTTPTNPPAGDMTAPSEGRRTRLGEVIYGAMFEVQIDLRYGGAEKAEYIADAVRRALEEAEPGDHPDYAAAHPLLRAVEAVESEDVTA